MSPSASFASPIYEELKAHLQEMFQMDRGDLDFGIYRIMNMKRDEVNDFLNKDLLTQVRDILEAYKPADFEETKRELTYAEANTHKFSPDYINGLRQKLSQSIDVDKIETEIYSDLYNFFKRYYSEGDFMSLRRYKEGVYALPYEGEEVKLHWANHDQYYIKTSEDLKHYTFKVDDGKRVRFEIVNADTEKNNNKEVADKARRFLLAEENYLSEEDGQLTIHFEYRPDNAARKQDDINKSTAETLLRRAECLAFNLNIKTPSEKNADRTVLEKHLIKYTAKFTFDYFIHKDLDGFLRRELDFFIKNEIMHLDDIENEAAPKVENYLAKIRAMRQVAHKIIALLAQIEEFQKKLWLKKKFVLDTHYCVTLDHIIGSSAENTLLPQIIANEAQREEWVELFAIDDVEGYSVPLTMSFLKSNDKLQVDTKFFDAEFKYTLLSIFDDLDETTNGLLISSDNFQALNLLQDRYREQVKCIYIDPPYNTGEDEYFLYKDNYQSSTWFSMMTDRIEASKKLMTNDAPFFCSIDQDEWHHLKILLSNIFGKDNYVNEIVWQKLTAAKKQSAYFSNVYEKIIAFRKSKSLTLNKIYIASDNDEKNYQYIESQTDRKYGSFDFTQRGQGEARYFGDKLLTPPIGKHWIWGQEKINAGVEEGRIIFTSSGLPRVKRYLDEKEGNTVGDFWIDNEIKPLSANSSERTGFDTQKPICLINRLIKSCPNPEIILDYFAGSGTTGVATINFNRDNDKNNKFILLEVGECFSTILVPRIKKQIYSSDWDSNQRPKSRDKSISQVIKYMTLEQYEDTLDNLQMKKTAGQDDLFDQNPKAHESYMLNYMLNVESKGSSSLLNIDGFNDPLKYMLKIIRDGEVNDTAVDLIETFNYLIGLKVQKINQAPNGIISVEGKTPQDEKCLIIWRDTSKVNGDALNEWFKVNHLQGQPWARVIYVNGDNNLENLKPAGQQWEVRLTEEEFKLRMFDVTDV